MRRSIVPIVWTELRFHSTLLFYFLSIFFIFLFPQSQLIFYPFIIRKRCCGTVLPGTKTTEKKVHRFLVSSLSCLMITIGSKVAWQMVLWSMVSICLQKFLTATWFICFLLKHSTRLPSRFVADSPFCYLFSIGLWFFSLCYLRFIFIFVSSGQFISLFLDQYPSNC